MNHQINNPIFAIYMEGDVQDKVSKNNYTKIASYEALRKETFIAVETNLLANRQQIEQGKKQITKEYSNYGKVKECNYHKEGMDFIQMITNN